MNCPKCAGKTTVKDTNWAGDLKAVRRRRRCLTCGYRFNTYEIAAPKGMK